jgi:hypothetical protein
MWYSSAVACTTYNQHESGGERSERVVHETAMQNDRAYVDFDGFRRAVRDRGSSKPIIPLDCPRMPPQTNYR